MRSGASANRTDELNAALLASARSGALSCASATTLPELSLRIVGRDWLGLGEKRWAKRPDEEVRPAKTAWDWLQLAVVPVVLAIIALTFNASQTAREQKREEERTRQDRALAADAQRDSMLRAYLAEMSDLILERKLLTSRRDSDVVALARVLTLTTLRRLDGVRRGDVIQFLAQSHLLEVPKSVYSYTPGRRTATLAFSRPKLDLSKAELRGAVLSDAVLRGINLAGADLREARFDGAELNFVLLVGADLRAASFRRAFFSMSDLTAAKLDEASFDRAVFVRVSNTRASLNDACLTDASFVEADLSGVDFRHAHGLRVDLSRALGYRGGINRRPCPVSRFSGP